MGTRFELTRTMSVESISPFALSADEGGVLFGIAGGEGSATGPADVCGFFVADFEAGFLSRPDCAARFSPLKQNSRHALERTQMLRDASLFRRKLAAPVLDSEFAEAKRPILSKPDLLAVRADRVCAERAVAGRLIAARAKRR